MKTIEQRVFSVLARTGEARPLAAIAEQLPGVQVEHVQAAVLRLHAEGVVVLVAAEHRGAPPGYRLRERPDRDWRGVHVRFTLVGFTLALVGAGLVALAIIFARSIP